MKLWLRLLISGALLGFILWQLDDIGAVVRLAGQMRLEYVLAILFVFMADRALMAYKWRRLLMSRGLSLGFWQAMKIYCAAMVWGMVLPATVGADAFRAFNTARLGHETNTVIASILIERIIGFLAALIFGLLGFAILFSRGDIDARFIPVWWIGSAVLLGAALLLVASLNKRSAAFLFEHPALNSFRRFRVFQKLEAFHQAYLGFGVAKGPLFVFFAWTLIEQFMPILDTWLIAHGLGVDVGLSFVIGAVPLVLLMARLPISIDGIGVYDGAFVLIMGFAGVSPAESFTIALMGRVLQTASWLPWWLAHVFENREIRPARLTSLDTLEH